VVGERSMPVAKFPYKFHRGIASLYSCHCPLVTAS
jgi:hypothetical protein